MLVIVQLFMVILSINIASSFGNDYFQMGISTGGEVLSESVKAMLNDGFSQQEIVKTIKSELGMKRINAYIEKMYDGVELTDDEISTMKSGEVEDSDEELSNILEEFERVIENQINNDTYANNGTGSSAFPSEKDLVKELFIDNDEYSEKSESAGENVPLPKPNYAYSPYDLIRLVKTEDAIYKPLKKYIKKMENKLQILKSYAKNYEDATSVTTRQLGFKASFEDKAMAVVSNPLSSYKMIRRFAFQLPEVWKSVGEDMEEDLWKDLSQVRMKHQPPNDQDWKEAIEALFRIQYYNGYDAKQFAKGELGSIKSNVTLSAEECLEIGIRAMALKKHDFALEWLYLAKSKSLNDLAHSPSEVDMNFIEQTLKYAIREHNKAWDLDNRIKAKAHVFTTKVINPVHIEGAMKKSTELRKISKQFRSQEEYDYPIPYNFVSLCAGENLQTEAERSQLKCWQDRSRDPYFYINPLKIELLNTDPYLIQIYDVIGDKMISHVKRIAISKLQRSQVVNYNDPEADDVSFVRTSSQTWIPQWHPGMGLQNLTMLIEKITGLTTRKHGSSEDFQVACYGTSHHYDEHLDAVQDARRTAEFGERIATLMLYLSTVEEGGKTAFPVLGVAANAVKGSAVFWYNLKKNGQPDKRTWHGGCPVVHGVKWVMNNWVLYNENFKNRLCSPSPDE